MQRSCQGRVPRQRQVHRPRLGTAEVSSVKLPCPLGRESELFRPLIAQQCPVPLSRTPGSRRVVGLTIRRTPEQDEEILRHPQALLRVRIGVDIEYLHRHQAAFFFFFHRPCTQVNGPGGPVALSFIKYSLLPRKYNYCRLDQPPLLKAEIVVGADDEVIEHVDAIISPACTRRRVSSISS